MHSSWSSSHTEETLEVLYVWPDYQYLVQYNYTPLVFIQNALFIERPFWNLIPQTDFYTLSSSPCFSSPHCDPFHPTEPGNATPMAGGEPACICQVRRMWEDMWLSSQVSQWMDIILPDRSSSPLLLLLKSPSLPALPIILTNINISLSEVWDSIPVYSTASWRCPLLEIVEIKQLTLIVNHEYYILYIISWVVVPPEQEQLWNTYSTHLLPVRRFES